MMVYYHWKISPGGNNLDNFCLVPPSSHLVEMISSSTSSFESGVLDQCVYKEQGLKTEGLKGLENILTSEAGIIAAVLLIMQCVCDQGARPPTLPPISTKTLHHPSFMPLYMDYRQCWAGHHVQEGESPPHHILFYCLSVCFPTDKICCLLSSPSHRSHRDLLLRSHHGLWEEDPQHSVRADGECS